jgi:hypothetical protein
MPLTQARLREVIQYNPYREFSIGLIHQHDACNLVMKLVLLTIPDNGISKSTR